MFLRKLSWRNSFALKRGGNWCGMRYEIRVFLSQSARRWGEMIVFLSALRNIGNCEDVKLKYFSLWRDSSLCCASFRKTRFCFLLTIRNLNYFKRKDFKLKTMLLREQSGNSLANWWSVCFKMFFPNGFICVVASTGSATDCGKFIGLGNKMSSL